MLKRFIFVFALPLCFATQSQMVAEVLEGPRGPVEFVGLENWTASDLYKAIQETDPDKPFHACAAVMISELKFPDAAAFAHLKRQDDGSMEMYTVVVGIEDTAHVQYRTAGNETIVLPETWQELQDFVEEDLRTVETVAYVRYLLAEPDVASQLAEKTAEEAEESSHGYAVMFGANAATVEKVWPVFDVLENTIVEEDQQRALEVLAKDQSWSARVSATIILANFSDKATSWHGLADALIDPAPQVRDVARKLLEGLRRAGNAVPVLWTEARETLLALLGGTYPFAFNEILKVLVATEIDPIFGQELVRERPKLLLGFVALEHDRTREAAHSFLKAISGEDFERDVQAWSDWFNEKEDE